ncbi:unnamed protein product [Mytilus edulis]|uniref:Ig-like domain-containing protein n=1 Tax=Mytilus edulis TaxID=6550 RepID=A0A8S3V9Z5_MYTED|nr:unnamed protein product [Mytilus edulis]
MQFVVSLLHLFLVFTESTIVNEYSIVGGTVLLHCKDTLSSTIVAIQWLRLNPSKNVTESTYTDGSTINEEIPHQEMAPNTTAIFQVENNTKSIHHLETENENQYFDITTLSTDSYKNTTDAENVTKSNEQTTSDTDFQNEAIYWVVGMVGSGVVVFITVFLSYIYLKKLNDIVNNANQGHTMSIEYREEQTNSIGNDNIEIYERSENVRENTHARSATRIERRTINNEVYEIVQQHESSQNIQMEHLTQDEGNRTYQTVSAELSNDDHIYKELSSGQC